MGWGTRLPGPRAVLGSAVQAQAAGRSRIGGGGRRLDVGSDSTRSWPSAEPRRGAGTTATRWAGSPARPFGPGGSKPNAPSSSPNSSAASTPPPPSLAPPGRRHGLGMPARNPEAVRQRAIAAARQRSGQPATPTLDPVFVALNPGVLPTRPRSPAELYQWVRREEQYATLGANVVVELYSESHARRPTTRAWAIIRRADRSHRLVGQRASRSERRHAERADRPGRS